MSESLRYIHKQIPDLQRIMQIPGSKIMRAKAVKIGILAVTLPVLGISAYNLLGAISIEKSEECWLQSMPSGSEQFETVQSIANGCGLTERKLGVLEYPDGVRRTSFTKRFTYIGLSSGWNEEIMLDVAFIGDTNLAEARLDRWDGQAWMMLP
jgi:hypothetical protein